MTKHNADLSQLLSFDTVDLGSVLQKNLKKRSFQQKRMCLIRSPKASPSIADEREARVRDW